MRTDTASAPGLDPSAPPGDPLIDAGRRQRRARRGRAGLIARTLLAILVSLILLFPLYWMVVVALSSRSELLGGQLRLWPRELTLSNFERVFSAFPVATWFSNSVAISLVTAAIIVVFNLLAGYAFAHLRFRGATPLFLLALSTLMVPVQVIMVALFRLVTTLDLYGTYWAVILPTAASAFGIFLARQFMLGIPRELIEAARIDGAGHVTVPRVDREFAPMRSWSTMIAVVSPSSTSTSGRGIEGMNPCTKELYVSLISRWDSAATVENTSEDFPEPDTPVKTVRRRLGISIEMSCRLFCRAPSTRMTSWARSAVLSWPLPAASRGA